MMTKRKYVRKGALKGAPTLKVRLPEPTWRQYIKQPVEVTSLIETLTKTIQEDIINHPKHYNAGKYETIDVIEDIIQHYKNPIDAFLIGELLRYISRAPLKGNNYVEHLQKAQWYMNRLIDRNKNDSKQ